MKGKFMNTQSVIQIDIDMLSTQILLLDGIRVSVENKYSKAFIEGVEKLLVNIRRDIQENGVCVLRTKE